MRSRIKLFPPKPPSLFFFIQMWSGCVIIFLTSTVGGCGYIVLLSGAGNVGQSEVPATQLQFLFIASKTLVENSIFRLKIIS